MNQTVFDKVKQYRRDLHAIPELGFDLYKTSAYIKHHLTAMGYQIIEVANTGVLAVIEGQSTKTIAFRADMDGLPISEQLNVSFRSTHEGVMHACGHDGHMAMLLGFAEMIAAKRHLQKSVMLIFEPAEETLGGAKDIVNHPRYQERDIEAVFALHLDPELEAGKLGLIEGIMTAQDGDFDITIHGINAHGTSPHQGNDALLAASSLVQQYYTIASRSIDPLVSAMINIGTIESGEGRNIIAKSAHLSGSIRAFDYYQYERIKERMRAIDKGIETAYNVTIENTMVDLHPPVRNDHHLFITMCQVFNRGEYELIQPRMLAEDFSYYQQHTPGLFIMLGVKNQVLGYTQPLHSSFFDFDERVLMVGVESYLKIAQTMDVFK